MKGRKVAGLLHLSSVGFMDYVQKSLVSYTLDSQLPGEGFIFRTEPECKFLAACQPIGHVSDID